MPDYFLIEKQQLQAYEVLGGFLGDMMTLLESEGFYVRSDILYGHSTIFIQRDAAGRVFSNLVSNIMKYAQRDAEVSFYCREKPQYVEVRISNLVRQFEEGKPESTGFGARIVKRLMQEMDGEYQAEEKDGVYTTTLRFMKV
jgi:signal transduction histidine kinase